MSRKDEMFGPINKPLPNGIGQGLSDAKQSMIQENKRSSEIMCTGQLPNESLHSRLQGGSACALLVAKNNYYIFDPHSRDRNGRVVESGASVLLHFTTVRQYSSFT